MNMTQNQNIDPTKFTGIRMTGEADRNPEVKERRNKIVDRTNAFLEGLAAAREQETHSKGGLVLRSAGVITETDLGKTAHGMRAVGTDYEYGISLTGDGKETPLELQAVMPNVWGAPDEGFTVVTMKGTDPIARMMHGDHAYESGRGNEEVASFTQEEHHGGITQYEGYTIYGDGDFKQKEFTGEGAHTSRFVSGVEQAALAEQRLEDAIAVVQRNLAS